MEYQKQTITKFQKVASEALNNNEQAYKIVYYDATDKFMDKIAVYFLWKPHKEDKEYAKRSIYFLAPEQLKMFIHELVNAYFSLREKRFGNSKVPLSQIRLTWLDYFLEDIKKEQLKRWKNHK